MDKQQRRRLTNPEFLEWLKQFRLPIEPDEQDYDQPAQAQTASEYAEQYGLAQARKIERLYEQWRASLS